MLLRFVCILVNTHSICTCWYCWDTRTISLFYCHLKGLYSVVLTGGRKFKLAIRMGVERSGADT